MSNKKSIIAYYDNEASEYDKKRFKGASGIYGDNIQKEIILKMIDNFENKKILEIGTGTGRFSKEILKKEALFFGIDYSFNMLLKTRFNCLSLKKDLFLSQADGYNLPFKDNSFDACICINVLNHMEYHERCLCEINRVLKPGGILIANFHNLISFYFLIGILVNIRKKSIFQEVYSKWFNYPKIKKEYSEIGFEIKSLKGNMLFPNKTNYPLFIILKKLDLLSRETILKHISGNIFIKANKIINQRGK